MKRYTILVVFVVLFGFVAGGHTASANVINSLKTEKINISYDNKIDSKYPYKVMYKSTYIDIGHSSVYGDEMMRYIGKVNLNNNINNIQKAVIKIDRVSNTWDDNSTYSLYRANSAWDTSKVTWNNAPKISSSTYVSQGTKGDYGIFEFNVTSLVKGWMNGSIPNNGFIIAKSNESSISTKNAEGMFASASYPSNGGETRPYLEITYGTAKTIPTALNISSFTPTSGVVGNKVTVYGSGLSRIDIMEFINTDYTKNDVYPATILNRSDTQATIILPTNIPAGTYYIKAIYIGVETAVSLNGFTVKDSIVYKKIKNLKISARRLITTISNFKKQLAVCNIVDNSGNIIYSANNVMSKANLTESEMDTQINALLAQITKMQPQVKLCNQKSVRKFSISYITPASGFPGSNIVIHGAGLNDIESFQFKNIATSGIYLPSFSIPSISDTKVMIMLRNDMPIGTYSVKAISSTDKIAAGKVEFVVNSPTSTSAKTINTQTKSLVNTIANLQEGLKSSGSNNTTSATNPANALLKNIDSLQAKLSNMPTINSISSERILNNTSITVYGTNLTSGGNPTIEIRSTSGVLKDTVYFINLNNISSRDIIFKTNIAPGIYKIDVKTPNGTSNAVSFRIIASQQTGNTKRTYTPTQTTTQVYTPIQKTTQFQTPTQVQRPTTTFSRNMWKGMRGDDVKKLQQYFNSTNEFRLARTGPGSSGDETPYYGFLLESAVQNFQCKYRIACSGSANSNGYGVVGPKTRAKLNELYKQEGGNTNTANTGGISTTNTNTNVNINSTNKAKEIATIKTQIRQILQMVLKLQQQLAKQQSAQ